MTMLMADLLWVDTDSSSTSELIALFSKELSSNFLVSAARLLCWDCRRYWSLPLSCYFDSDLFELAATSSKYSFDFTALARQMDTINLKTAKLQGYVYDHLEIDEHGAARVTFDTRALEEIRST